ncbi:glycosyltransferase 8 domain-containing protein 2 isoform X3 [Petaurus breviceps papuanus]|uniref:glycosyltransferase 8 domain-containing protein 2 isoform X3 n=1 Tax=Petaurus breviceps papuanus TaxID=3040969 RepID=UPI0036DCBC87
MALLRRINQILLFLLVLTICMILYKKAYKVSTLKNETDDAEDSEEMEEEIPVVVCAAAGRMGAAMAAINSIYSNTDANVLFYVVGLRNTLSHIRKWIEQSKLREIKFKIVEFNPMVLKGKIRPDTARPELLQPLNFVRFYLPLLIHKHEKVIYLDDDVIVQGDIQELYDTKLMLGHAAAFSDDCDLPSTHEMVRSAGMQAGVQRLGTLSTFFRRLSYFTGMEGTSLGTSLVFTLTSGKAGSSLTLLGNSNLIVERADTKTATMCSLSPHKLMTHKKWIIFMNVFSTHLSHNSLSFDKEGL